MACHAIFDQTSSSHLSCQSLRNKLQVHPHPSSCSPTLFYPTTSMSLQHKTPFIITFVLFHMALSQLCRSGFNVHFAIIFFFCHQRVKVLLVTCMRFIQANPERAVAAMKCFHAVLNESLFGWILNTRQNSALKRKIHKSFILHLCPFYVFFFISLSDFLPCLTQLPAA